jgi:DNA replication initiation complex subunit (GINS family)
MPDSDKAMTIEDLAEVYRVEKKSGSLYVVRPDFYPAVAELLRTQRANYDKLLSEDPDSISCEGANSRRKKGMQLSKEIVEMRMDKITKMALRGAMGANNTFEALTPEEKKLYDHVLILVKDHKAIISRLSGSITHRTPDISDIFTGTPVQVPVAVPVPEDTAETPEETSPAPQPEIYEDDLGMIPQEDTFDMDCMEPEQEQEIPADELDAMIPSEKESEPAPKEEAADDYMVVRVLEDLDTFSGPLRDYTLRREEIVRLPEMFAQALINRNLAVKVSMSP